MDSQYKIKKVCYKGGSLVPGCLFANRLNSPFIRQYVGVDSDGRYVIRVIRSYNRDVCFYEYRDLFPFRPFKVVPRHAE